MEAAQDLCFVNCASNNMQDIEELRERVATLEGRENGEIVEIGDGERRVRDACKRKGIVYRMYHMPVDYYERTLRQRADLLHAPSIHHLCKSILVKNIAWSGGNDPFEVSNAEYYCLIVQYTAKLDIEKLWRGVHRFREEKDRLPKNKFSFRMATQEESDELSGFKHNAVSPVGMNKQVPIIVSKSLQTLSPPIIYLGGGEVHVKLQVNLKQFNTQVHAQVLDMTIPRTYDEIISIGNDE